VLSLRDPNVEPQSLSLSLSVGDPNKMILELEHWHLGYEQILTDCRAGDDGSTKTALLLCNADVDAMACARILSYMLRSDGIHYQLLPCTNYSALEKHLSTIPMEDVSSVVLLNFGAARNLTRLFDQHLHETSKVYVMDCRRPVHLANIYAGENVVIFWDRTQGEDLPSDGDNLSGDESSSSSEDEDDDSEDSSDDDTDGEKSNDGEEEAAFDDVVDATARRQEAAVGDGNESAQQEDIDYDGEDEREAGDDTRTRHRTGEADEDSASSPKRRRTDKDASSEQDGATDVEQSDRDSPDGKPTTDISPRELHRQRRDRLRAYYSTGSFYGSPAAYVAYRLATELRFGEQPDLLWLACVGVTDAYLHARLDVAGYTQLALDLRRYTLKLFPNDMYERAINTVYAEDLTGAARGDQQNKTKITFSDNGRIIAEKDYRFFLLRHSSLFDSMVHSDYISTKLQVWTKRGMHKLQELLAKMGYPLEECQQPFAFMKPALRRRLHEKIGEHAAVSKMCCLRNYPMEPSFSRFYFCTSGLWVGKL
jgi:cell division control protein 45